MTLLKDWYNLEDAARVLGDELNEELSAKDVIQLGLDGKLAISVWLSICPARVDTESDLKSRHPVYGETIQAVTLGRDGDSPGRLETLHGVYHIDHGVGGFYSLLTNEAVGASLELTRQRLWRVKSLSDPEKSYTLYKHLGGGTYSWDNEGPELSQLGVRKEDLSAYIVGRQSEGDEVKRDAEDIRTLEVMGLLLVAFSRQSPKYQHGEKPNRSAVAEAMMDVVPEGVAKMKKRKLQDALSDALEAWEVKIKR